MKLVGVVAALAVAAHSGAYGQRRDRDDTGAVKRACDVAECFLERDVRDFDVIDKTHLIVYVGAQRCAFHVELSGTFCDLTFAPELSFVRANEISTSPRSLRICSNDLGIEVDGGVFTESPSTVAERDRLGNPRSRSDCRILNVRAITDDQLIEFLVSRDSLPPIPPMGQGQIEVGEQEEQGTPATTAEGDPADNEQR